MVVTNLKELEKKLNNLDSPEKIVQAFKEIQILINNSNTPHRDLWDTCYQLCQAIIDMFCNDTKKFDNEKKEYLTRDVAEKLVNNSGPKRIATLFFYSSILSPDYTDEKLKTLLPDQWANIQAIARDNMKRFPRYYASAGRACIDAETGAIKQDVIINEDWDHWKSIADGNVPFGFRVLK